MWQVPIIPNTHSSHPMPPRRTARRSIPLVDNDTSYQQRLHNEYLESLQEFSRNYNPRNLSTSINSPTSCLYRGVPYLSPEEVFLRCNTAEADDDDFGDIGRSDAIQAFQVSGKHRAQRRRGNLSQYERGLLDHTLR